MTMVIIGIALGVTILVFGGPAEFATAVNGFVRDSVQAGVDLARSR